MILSDLLFVWSIDFKYFNEFPIMTVDEDVLLFHTEAPFSVWVIFRNIRADLGMFTDMIHGLYISSVPICATK